MFVVSSLALLAVTTKNQGKMLLVREKSRESSEFLSKNLYEPSHDATFFFFAGQI